MKLILEHAPNPDIPGYWQEPVDPPTKAVVATSIDDARTQFRDWITRNGLGGGNLTKLAGELYDDDKRLVGRFSYNGNFWLPDGTEYQPESE